MNLDKFIKEGWNSFEFPPEDESLGTIFEICEEDGNIVIYVIAKFSHCRGFWLRNIAEKKDPSRYTLISTFSEPGEFYPADRQWRYLPKDKYMAFL